MHHGRETRFGIVKQAAVFGAAALLLPNHGSTLFRDGVRQRRRFDVPDTAVRQVQRTRGSVSTLFSIVLSDSTLHSFVRFLDSTLPK